MISSGIRVDAWEYLKWKHVIPILGENNQIISTKLIVLVEKRKSIKHFIKNEAHTALKEWMEFRSS
jgi:hypothetical protein